MKILLIANSSIVFGKELKEVLNERLFDTYLLDFESLELFHKDEIDKSVSKKFARYKNIPKLHMFFRMYFIKKFLKSTDFDIINIHYSRWIYLLILKTLEQSKLIITFYGSDFYRVSDRIKMIQTKLYEKADALSFTNPLTKDAFVEYFNSFEEKSSVCRFGLKTLDYIEKNRKINKIKIRKSLGYSQERIIVTCGYNATSAQQHKKIIDALVKIDEEILEKVQFIFPMTYGNMTYKEEVKLILKMSRLNCLVLEKYLYEDDNAYVKLASDIMINVLETDSFSGSMQEFLYAQNYVITGSWLPYDLFDKEGIIYSKIDSVDALGDKLVWQINNMNTNVNLEKNRDTIYNLSSWKNNINSWVKMYEKV